MAVGLPVCNNSLERVTVTHIAPQVCVLVVVVLSDVVLTHNGPNGQCNYGNEKKEEKREIS